MAAHIQRDDMEPVAEMPREAVECVGAAGVAVHADEWRPRGIAPIEVVQPKPVDRDPLARRLRQHHCRRSRFAHGTSFLSDCIEYPRLKRQKLTRAYSRVQAA